MPTVGRFKGTFDETSAVLAAGIQQVLPGIPNESSCAGWVE
jgi:hypothetical protein